MKTTLEMQPDKNSTLAAILKGHRERVGRVYGRFLTRVSGIRKRRLEDMKKKSLSADEEQLAAIRKSLEDNR